MGRFIGRRDQAIIRLILIKIALPKYSPPFPCKFGVVSADDASRAARLSSITSAI
jgi:hypothetical protein